MQNAKGKMQNVRIIHKLTPSPEKNKPVRRLPHGLIMKYCQSKISLTCGDGA